MREVGDVNILKKFCEDFCAIVEKHCTYIIVSGYLAIATGRSRATQDIDEEKILKLKKLIRKVRLQ